jgi:uncharacterized protein YjbJ (UPF0337 family)
MSITSDIRSYADTAVQQGKQVVESTISTAQAQFNDATGQANEFVGKLTGTAKGNVSGLTGKASDTVNDLRAQAEKAVNVDAIRAAVEPYLAQAKGYSHTVTDRAEGLLNTVKNDKRVAKLVTTAESLTGVVVETVQSITGRGTKPAPAKPAPAKAAPKPAASAAAKPAATRSAARTTPAAKATTRKAGTRKASPKPAKA